MFSEGLHIKTGKGISNFVFEGVYIKGTEEKIVLCGEEGECAEEVGSFSMSTRATVDPGYDGLVVAPKKDAFVGPKVSKGCCCEDDCI